MMQQARHHLQAKHFVRASLFTFLLLCIIVMAILMLVLGGIFQAAAYVAPWLIANGWTLLKFALSLLVCFRAFIVLTRFSRTLHKRLKAHADYRTFLVLVRGTLRYLLQKILWALLQ